MKGKKEVIDSLNALLADELIAIDQYMVHAEMFDNWGYAKLAKKTEERAITEMKHAEIHISRLLFLEGIPAMSRPMSLHIGADVEAMLKNDLASEEEAIKRYNTFIKTAGDAGDYGTQDMLKEILKQEEEHLDWIEAQLDQIKQMGLAIYLTEQTS